MNSLRGKWKLSVSKIIYLVLLTIVNVLYGEQWVIGSHALAGMVIAMDLVCLAALFLADGMRARIRRKQRLTKALGILWWVLLPAVILVISQMLIGFRFFLRGKYLALNLVLFYLIQFFFTALIGNLAIAQITWTTVVVSLSLANCYLILFRNKPLTVFDFFGAGTAMDVVSSYSFTLNARPVLLLQVSVLVLILTGILQAGHFAGRKPLFRIAGIAGACLVFWLLGSRYVGKDFLEPGDFFSMKVVYRTKGMIPCMMSEVHFLKADPPEGYSKEAVERAAKAYAGGEAGAAAAESEAAAVETEEAGTDPSTAQQAAGTGTAATDTSAAQQSAGAGASAAQRTADDRIQPVNIIAIMNESLADLESLYDIDTNQEVLPYIHSMSGNVVKGKLHMPVYGGGTADSEYEFLTGNRRAFLPNETVAYTAFVHNPEYGIPRILQAQGYRAIALHPGNPNAWNRATVYPDLGFEEFLNNKNWGSELRKLRGYTSDECLYQKISDIYSEKEEGEKLFTFAVTIQNHGGYQREDENFDQKIKLNYANDYPSGEQYLSLMYESDQAFKGLIEHFEKVKEPTMIVMFGDHHGAFEQSFRDELANHVKADLTGNDSGQRLYDTPYILWTNYDIGETGLSEAQLSGMDTSANYFGAEMLQAANVSRSPYFQFLEKMQSELPVAGVGMVKDKDGNWYDMNAVPEVYQEDWKTYQYFVYNEVFDRKNLVTEAYLPGEQ